MVEPMNRRQAARTTAKLVGIVVLAGCIWFGVMAIIDSLLPHPWESVVGLTVILLAFAAFNYWLLTRRPGK